ncbi:AAA family ATPase [Vibrio sp. S4M6]|uniref:SPOR domain-containing protein n=1 Tax=Vibrio sinus TaxID=2946865 RepID=UPI00202AAA79|nr:AAA family ATPase [Vibrio sinus]MCL9780437.1 AAA family ATPase [Vibrio sinus]
MSLAHELRVLEIESQVELLERVQLLTNFGSNLVTIRGEQGSGKSWIAHRYLEAWSEGKNQALLMCHPSQDDEQHRSVLIPQLFSEPLFNPQDNLPDSFTYLLEDEACDIVIVVDDAHHLSDGFIAELWSLVQQAQYYSNWTLNVLLFSGSKHTESVLSRVSQRHEQKPIEIEIDTLNQEEADRFFEQLVVRFVEDDMERRVRNAYRKVKLLPGEIMRLGEQKVTKRIIIRSMVGSPSKIALLVVLIAVIIGGGYWWMLAQPNPESSAQTAQEQTAIPTLPNTASNASTTDGASKTASSSASATSTQNPLDKAAVVDDTASLPPQVVAKAASVGTTDTDKNRVVISSAIVDKLMQDEASIPATKASDAKAAAPANTANDVTTSTPAVSQTSSAPSQAQASPTQSVTFSTKQLESFSPRSYTLQLAAMNTLPEVKQFIEKYDLNNKVFVYPTVRSGKDWYIVTYNNYPTIQLARDAVGTLPSDLQSVGPWAKSLSQVQREINRAN